MSGKNINISYENSYSKFEDSRIFPYYIVSKPVKTKFMGVSVFVSSTQCPQYPINHS